MILRYLGIAFPGFLALSLIMRAFIGGNTSDIRYAAGILLFLGLSLLIRAPRAQHLTGSGRTAIAALVMLVPIAVIFPFTVVVMIFGSVDMAAFVFHLVFGMGGTPWADIVPYIVTAFVLWAAVAVTALRFVRAGSGHMMPALAVAAAAVALNPLFNDFALTRAQASLDSSLTLLEEFHDPRIIDTAERPNIVFLYLEGFDRGYMDTDRFGDIAAPLAALEREATAFSKVSQIEATGWSLAGTTASQCGAPLLPLGARWQGDLDKEPRILPALTCLSGILSDRGYAITYMSGAQLSGEGQGYYGFDSFFATHGGARMEHRDTIPERRNPADPADEPAFWGKFDSELLHHARYIIDTKARDDRPFAVMVATMDTHGPRAMISPDCSPDSVPRILPDMRESVRCTSNLAAEFVTALRRDYGPALRIVMLSDHLSHGSNLSDLLESQPRYNTVMLFGEGAPPALHARAASMVDVYPTILDWLGLLEPGTSRAGLGVSLLSGDLTLVETLGVDAVNDMLRVDTQLARHLWRAAE